MNELMSAVAAFLLLNIGTGLVRVWRGPSTPDRMLATLLFGTTGTAILLILAEVMSNPSIRDAAMVLALLSAISTIVFVRGWRSDIARGSEPT